jgi:hypothetical protein
MAPFCPGAVPLAMRAEVWLKGHAEWCDPQNLDAIQDATEAKVGEYGRKINAYIVSPFG